ncbi:sugar phosphate isomerase/epimerase family protein [Neobacillus drentensis]|uniref:sugar phosphate isomerase/epimerase family protein n=1 Tax=Neobacillus drentensis TaxID=220684 RepID=UPI003B589C1F
MDNLELKVVKAMWGMTEPLEESFKMIKEAGYSGIESVLPDKDVENQFKELLEKYELDYITQILTSGDYLASFETQVERALGFNPLLINSHSAKDDMHYDNQLHFFESAVKIEKVVNVPIVHETHRGRSMYTPWKTVRLLNDVNDLKISADFSHWCCVCESLLEDQIENLEIAMNRAYHIHLRVGYPGGPQVPDPSAPEYRNELLTHEKWWKQIYLKRQKEGHSFLTVVPEFGPPPFYMHTLPYTNQPVSDLWTINLWMANRFREQIKRLSY